MLKENLQVKYIDDENTLRTGDRCEQGGILFTQRVPFLRMLSLLPRLGQVPALGFFSTLGSPTIALTTLGCHCVEIDLPLLSRPF